jgi:hypothetical protein
VHADAAVERLQFVPAHVVHEGFAGHDAAGIDSQGTEQLELVTGQRPLLAVEAHYAGTAIDLQKPAPGDRLRSHPGPAA